MQNMPGMPESRCSSSLSRLKSHKRLAVEGMTVLATHELYVCGNPRPSHIAKTL
jgi:hypothetical protein